MDETKDEIKDEIKDDKVLDLSRREAIAKGIEDLDKGNKGEQDKEKSLTLDDEVDKDESDENDESKEELNVDEIKDAVNLFRTLNDPDKGPKLLRILVNEAGIDKTSSKDEKKEAVKSIKQVVKEKLGTEYQFLADRLGDILEDIVPKIAEEKSRETRDRLDAREKAELSAEIDTALTAAFDQYDAVPTKVKERFNELIDEMPPIPGKTKPRVYFDRLLKVAFDETKTEFKLKSSKEENKENKNKDLSDIIKDRVKRNKSDATSRLASKGAAAEVDETSKTASQPKSRREAIERAVKETESALKA